MDILRSALHYLVSLLITFIWLPQTCAQSLHLVNGKQSKSISFNYIKNLIIIPLHLNGKGPYNFVLDTGIGITLITDPGLADSLKLTNLRTLKVIGFGEGKELLANVTPPLFVNIDNEVFGELSAAILKEDSFSLSSYAGMPVHGLIGYEFFSSFIVRLNYFTHMLKLYPPDADYVPRRGYHIPIEIEERKPYLKAEISLIPGEKRKARFIIDTGAGHPLSLETDSAKPYPVPAPRIRANLGIGLGGSINGYIARIPTLTIGKFRFSNVISAFPDYKDAAGKLASITRNGNIGNTILRRFTVVFDYNRSSLYLRPNSKYRDPFEHDMSGLELAWTEPDFKRIIITRIEPGSAAEEAGLKVNDLILDINLIPVDQIGSEEVYNTFQSGHKRNLVLRIIKGGTNEIRTLILTLKRRI
ncbi:PDZ domain-containing protein [Arcticibacter sp. MXS-1]|uniref:PDZ domain-containing protein n=1 Tax=Arcticibacter sp. MXS-1 TaxID=3341726 RepID=UPI0035A84F68